MRLYFNNLLYEYAIVDLKAFEAYNQNQHCADYFEGASHADLMIIKTVDRTLKRFIKYAKKQGVEEKTILKIWGGAI